VAISKDLLRLDETLNDLARLYQFRSLDDRTYQALTVSQWYCLRILSARSPRAMSELAADLDIRVSTMTGVIDQLEEKGLVARVDHPEDRRSLRVNMTAKGRRLYQTAHQAFLSHLEPLLDDRTPAARREILAFLSDVVRVIQGWRANPKRIRRPH
jgi:DNA-binding MarR family transcriptional regulator